MDLPGDSVANKLHSQCRGPGSILGRETRSYIQQLKMAHATPKTQHSQINKYLKKYKEKIHEIIKEPVHPYLICSCWLLTALSYTLLRFALGYSSI